MALGNLDQIIAQSLSQQAQMLQRDRFMRKQLRDQAMARFGQQIQIAAAEHKREAQERTARRKRNSTMAGSAIGAIVTGGLLGAAAGGGGGAATAGTTTGATTGATTAPGIAAPAATTGAAIDAAALAASAGGGGTGIVGGAAVGGASATPGFSVFPAGTGPVIPALETATVGAPLAAATTPFGATSTFPAGLPGFAKGLVPFANIPTGMSFQEYVLALSLGSQIGGQIGGHVV